MPSFAARLPAFSTPNFRRYIAGQAASIAGTWLQGVALAWLVLRVTHSGLSVGLVTAAQFAPSVLVGAWAGAVGDRFDKRRAILCVQVVLFSQASILAILVAAKHVNLAALVALAAWQGLGNAFDAPVRQGLLNEIVPEAELPNAVATNSTIVQLGLVFGPTLAAVLIPTIGIAWCFAINAMSYVVMFAAIWSIDATKLIRRRLPTGGDTSVRAGIAYIRSQPEMRILLAVVACSSIVAFRLEVLLPLVAQRQLHGGSSMFSLLTALRGVGATIGSLYLASLAGPPKRSMMVISCAVMSCSLLLMCVPVHAVVLAATIPAGLGMMATFVATLSLIQLHSSREFRGRVVAVWFVVANFGTVVGAPLTGWIVEHSGTRVALAVGAFSMAACAALLVLSGPTGLPS